MQRQIRLRDVHSGKMSSDEEAANAITKFNGMDFDGRSLTINEARPIVRRDRGVGRSGESGGGRDHGEYGGGRNRWEAAGVCGMEGTAMGKRGRPAAQKRAGGEGQQE